MADNKVTYYVRIDDKYIPADMEKAEGKVSSSGAKIGKTVKGIGVAVGGALVGATIAAVKFGSEFESSMAKASTLIDTGAVDMGRLEDQILALSDSTGVAAADLGNSMYNALSAGIDLGEDNATMLAMLESSAKLAKAGFTDVDTALTATAKTMNAYGLEGEDAMNRVQKVLMQTQNEGITTVGELGGALAQVTPTAAAMGIEFEQVGAALASLTAQGNATAPSTTMLNALISELGKNGTTAANNLAKAAEGTEYAGMSFQDMVAAGVPLNDILDLMGTYASDTGVGMLDMFSSIEAGKAALALSGENSAAFTENLAAMGDEANVVGEAFDKVSSTSAEQMNRILNELKNTAIELFQQLLPFIEEFLPVLQELLGQLLPPIIELATNLVPLIGGALGQILPLLSDLLGEILPVLIDLCAQIIPPLVEIISAVLPVLIQLVTALMPLFETAISLLQPIIQLFLALLQPILDIISLAITPLIAIISLLIQNAITPLTGVLNVLKGVFSAVFTFISTSITNTVQTWLTIFSNLINFIKNVFTGNWRGAWENVKNIFKAIADGIGNAFKAPINFIIDLINNFLSGLNGLKIPDWVPGVGGKSFSIPLIPRLKKGMDFVPGDFFPAYLDYGERVLTREENVAFNALGGISGIEALALAAAQPLNEGEDLSSVMNLLTGISGTLSEFRAQTARQGPKILDINLQANLDGQKVYESSKRYELERGVQITSGRFDYVR